MKKKYLPGLIMKVDFSKDFDTMDWSFLIDLLKARGFSDRWVQWIETIFFSSKAKSL